MPDLILVQGFQWDNGNSGKNDDKHGVTDGEAEQVFFNSPAVLDDPKHSLREPRFHALGVTDDGRRLHVTFAIRDDGRLIGVISSRPMNRKERTLYDKDA